MPTAIGVRRHHRHHQRDGAVRRPEVAENVFSAAPARSARRLEDADDAETLDARGSISTCGLGRDRAQRLVAVARALSIDAKSSSWMS
jgi:hypothetical protein